MNFGTTVLLARALGPAEFGTFSVAYVLLVLSNSLQTSLVTQPHNVLGAPLEGAAYRDYTTSSAVGQVAVAVAFTLLALTAATLAPVLTVPGSGVLLALAAAIPAWQLQELVMRKAGMESRDHCCTS